VSAPRICAHRSASKGSGFPQKTVDDALQGITHVIRGFDLFEAVHIQRLLQALLGLPTPIYHHHRLLLRPDGKRFAKRDQAETLGQLRASGMTAGALKAELGFG